jgi:hypothetical protein
MDPFAGDYLFLSQDWEVSIMECEAPGPLRPQWRTMPIMYNVEGGDYFALLHIK